MYSNLRSYIEDRIAEFNSLPPDRKLLLDKLTSYIRPRVLMAKKVNLLFICTHNSRRSHMAQIWAQAAAAWYNVPCVSTFSGGTEATAFNPRAVSALERAGFKITRDSNDNNPIYAVQFDEKAEPIAAFSKIYSESPNPSEDFCAVMTCSNADRNCPTVQGADHRVAIAYDDPKEYDGTEHESGAYDDRCRQIACEMLYALSQISETGS
jgi:arsenate reductase